MIFVGGILLTWVIMSGFLFFSDYGRLHRSGYLPGPHAWHATHAHRSPTPADVERLQGWTTYAFVNEFFSLPPEFLKNSLLISDARYPDITILQEAKNKGVASEVMLSELKAVLNNRIAATSTGNTFR